MIHDKERKLIEEVAKCTALIDLAVGKLEDTTAPQKNKRPSYVWSHQ